MPARSYKNSRVHDFVVMIVMMIAPVCLGLIFSYEKFDETNIILIYLLSSVITARLTNGFGYSMAVIVMGILSYNYVFVPPQFNFAVYSPYYVITLIIWFIVTTIVSAITTRARENEKTALEREEDASILYKLASDLAAATRIDEIIEMSIRCIHKTYGTDCCYIPIEADGMISSTYSFIGDAEKVEIKDTVMIRNIAKSDESIGQGGVLKGNIYYEWPIQGFKGLHGYIGVPIEQAEKLTPAEISFISIIADTVSMAFGRIINLEDEQKVKQEAEQERYRSNLLRSISHDLRNPLAGIMGTSELIMQRSERDSQIWTMAKSIYKEASWLVEMVSNILSLSRLQDGNLKIKKEVEIVEDVIEEAISSIQVRYPNRHVGFTPPNEVIAAKMDPKLIQQVLINLIDNAFKHTEVDEDVWVEMNYIPEGKKVSISVRDRGTGLSEEDKEKVFAIFYTTHNHDESYRKGFGLGLPICDSILKAHGGTISADNNEDGKGAKFTIIFPTEC